MLLTTSIQRNIMAPSSRAALRLATQRSALPLLTAAAPAALHRAAPAAPHRLHKLQWRNFDDYKPGYILSQGYDSEARAMDAYSSIVTGVVDSVGPAV